MDPTLPAAALIAFLVAGVATPAGVSGAVFLLPVQVALGVPSPAVTPTNLVYNLIATPPAILRRRRDRGLDLRLAARLTAFAVPGVVLGAVLRVELLSGRRAVLTMIGVVLTVLGIWLLASVGRGTRPRPPRRGVTGAVAAAAGVLGGAYGIGGGSVISPVLTALGMPAHRVAPAALATTFATSAVGVAAFEVIAAAGASGPVAPRWSMGIALGLGGALGAYAGAVWQGRVSEAVIGRMIGALSLAVGAVHLGLAVAGA